MARRLNARAQDFDREFAALIEAQRDTDEDVSRSVRDIIADVRAKGDAALIAFALRFDGAELSLASLRVSDDEIAAADRACPEALKDALRFAALRIEAYHRRQLPSDESFRDGIGASLGWRWRPLQSVGK